MERTFRRCRRYAREFGAGAPSLLFTGGPGLGKTFLSACIARAVADNGFSVVYDTAGKLFSDFEAVKFGGNQQDLTRKYLQCDLLIIDDLGTEMTTQFTQSVLYRVLNDRLLENRPVIVSTNLSDQALRQRYSAPIASRLLAPSRSACFWGRTSGNCTRNAWNGAGGKSYLREENYAITNCTRSHRAPGAPAAAGLLPPAGRSGVSQPPGRDTLTGRRAVSG